MSTEGPRHVLLRRDFGAAIGYDLIRAVLNPIQNGKCGQFSQDVAGVKYAVSSF